MSDTLVPDEWRQHATILIVGEAPGKTEVAAGYPFAGASGWKLRQWMTAAGLARQACSVTNVFPFMPATKAGNLDEAVRRGDVTAQIMQEARETLAQKIAGMPCLRVIVPVGNYATYAVLGDKGKTPFSIKNDGITHVRGSIYAYTGQSHAPVKVVPTLHPAAVMRMPKWERRCYMDWQRIAQEVQDAALRLPVRNHIITPTTDDLNRLLAASNDPTTVMALDIETWGGTIHCIGFSWDSAESITLPLTQYGARNAADYWRCIADICAAPCEKVLQNGLFDVWWLHQRGITVRKYWWDTMAMHHTRYPMDNHSLEYQASLYTRQPYYKSEAKDAEAIVQVARQGFDKLLVYNGLDCCVTRELFDVHYSALVAQGQLAFYLRHYAEMLPAMHDAMVRGIRVNRAEVTQLTTQFHHEMIETRDKVSGLCGRTMFTVKTKVEKAILDAYESGLRDISAITAYVERQGLLGASVPKKFQEQQEKGISDTLLGMVLQGRRARGRKRTASGSVKTDAVALRRIAIESEGRDDIVTQIVDLTLQHRRAQKLRSMLKDEKIDDDGRFRCSYKFTPWSGRFSSSKSPSGKGDNLQNRDRSLKSLFVADPGCVLVQVDLSQAENRVVSALTGDSEMIRKARLLPGEWDEHTHNAELIFSEIEQRTVTKDMFAPEEWATRRFLGKVVTHASGYGLGPTKLADILLKVGLVRTLQECKMLLAASLSARPAIPVWQRETRELLLKTRTLVNSWGRTFYFQYDRLDDELYRKGYACIPQSEVGDLMNQYGWLPLYTFLQEKQMQSYIVLQVHDALVVNCLPEEVYTVMKTLRDALEQPRWYGGVFGRQVELVIPCEFSLGPTWKSIAEWKRFPTAQDVEKAVEKALIYGKSARCL